MYGIPIASKSEHFVEVLLIADYYGLGGLKAEVELLLLEHVDVSSACDLW